MKLGFIGLGMVGKSIHDVLNETYETICYDIKIADSNIQDVLICDIIFIAVPTLVNHDNTSDLTILNSVMDELHKLNYGGVICIKSTILPETTIGYINKYDNPNICFCPEFLKERSAYNDFKYNNKICIVGTLSQDIFEKVKTVHSQICNEFRMVQPTEAELTKYFQNVYNMNRIVFANAFYEVCKSKNVCYNNIIDNLLVRGEIDRHYLNCDENLRGPSGPCILKDTLVFNEYVKKLPNNKPGIFQTLIDDSKLYPKTVIGDTRTELEYFGKNL